MRKLSYFSMDDFTLFLNISRFRHRPDSTSDETFASGTGDIGFKSRANQISHTLSKICHRATVSVWASA